MIDDPDFETWLRFCFDPPAGGDPFNDWYWSNTEDPFRLSPPVAAAHVLELLQAPGALLAMHHDHQVAAGLKYIFDPGCGGDARLLGEPEVAQADRLAVASLIDRLYAEIVVPRCPGYLGHLSEDGGRLAGLAYMFWDTCFLGQPADEAEAAAYEAAQIEAMGRTLALPHAAAQEGALHGLGHAGGDRARQIIDDWLAHGRPARPELVRYAEAARTGCIQ